MKVRILVFGPKGKVKLDRNCTQFPFTLGRDKKNDLCLEERLASRFHAILKVKDDQLWLVDRKSRNGTLDTQGNRLTRVQVQSSLAFRIGKTRLQIIREDVKKIESDSTWVSVQLERPKRKGQLPDEDTLVHFQPQFQPRMVGQPQPLPAGMGGLKIDWVERGSDWVLDAKVIWGAFAFYAIAASWTAPFFSFQMVLDVLKAALMSLTLTTAIAGGVFYLCRRYQNEQSLDELWKRYLTFSCLTLGLKAITFEYSFLYPEGGMVILVGEVLYSIVISFYFILSLRWIWAVKLPMIRVLSIALFFFLVEGYMGFDEASPRWLQVVEEAQLIMPPREVPEDRYVSPQQFSQELRKSFQSLSRR